MLLPTSILMIWFSGLLSLALVGGGGYLIWAWDEGILRGDGYLAAGIGLLAFSALGQFPIRLLLRRPHRTSDAPRHERNGIIQKRNDGTKRFVEFLGPEGAPVLVLTHGWGLDASAWQYAHRLADRYRLVMWDLPGMGESQPHASGIHLDEMAADLEDLLAQVGDRPVVLAGHSIGGMSTLTLCRRHDGRLPENVVGLVMVHTTYTNPVRTARGGKLYSALEKPLLIPLMWLTIALSPLVRLMNLLGYLNGISYLMTARTQFSGEETWEQLEYATRFNLRASPAIAARGMLAMMHWDATDTLPKIDVPVLTIAANKDNACPPEALQRIADTVPNAERAMLTPASHMGFFERHEEWNETVSAFVDRCVQQKLAARGAIEMTADRAQVVAGPNGRR